MAVPKWVCLDCGKEFDPMDGKGKFSFNCPSCGSPKTVVKKLAEAKKGT